MITSYEGLVFVLVMKGMRELKSAGAEVNPFAAAGLK
jgi:hypothetical protein